MVFNRYSHYYDSLYAKKDYANECDFVEKVLDEYATQPVKTILDLGCGTGGHAILLAQHGYTLTGVDLSESMLSIASDKTKELNLSIDYQLQDIRQLSLGGTFDAVISMFAVMGYQTSNADLEMAIQSAHQHLVPGGLFIFDVWHGSAVLSERPEERMKTVEMTDGCMVRFAQPELDHFNHLVKVHYKLFHLRNDQTFEELNETHSMRYFFPQEIRYFLETNGFRVLNIHPFYNLESQLSEQDWNMTVIAEAI